MPTFVERLSAQKFSSAASTAFDIFVSGDSNARIAVDAGGKLTWGPGDGAGDVTLYRSAANTLKTDDALDVSTTGVVNLLTVGTPSSTPADGTVAIDTGNNKMWFRSSDLWIDTTINSSLTSADGGPSNAFVRYHVNADGGDATAN